MKKIALIEDDTSLIEACEQVLSDDGYAVIKAGDGLEGLAAIRQEKPDAVLLDLLMPTMTGFEVLKSISEDPDESIRKIPIIVLTNFSLDSDRRRAMDMGAKEYLVKSDVTLDEIIQAIKRHVA